MSEAGGDRTGPGRKAGAAGGGGAGDGNGVRRLGPDLAFLKADNPGPLTLDGTRTWILGSRRPVVVDPGPDRPGQVERLVEAVGARSVEAVCLTHAHRDHAGCADRASRVLDAPLRASRETLRRLNVGGRPLEDGEEIPVDGGTTRLVALATPGHSRDHLAYLWLPSRDLLTGDLVLGEGSSLVAHPDGRVDDYLASLERLMALEPSRILPAHGEPVEDPGGRLREYRRHRLERERQVREALEAGAASSGEVRERVYGPLPEGLRRPAQLSVLAHAARLRSRGFALTPDLEAELAEDRRGEGEGTEEVPRG